ncbi:N5-carboxyaminoimidazole ribonucleotide mutase [candidate division MSBL1 archaeon SCGC-AAA382F02]|uniref:N5-carboxyaminoimidazole ribonucleotide mutase n=1 Tax=candidate division MSBL1 archaeon SCGC-AAA382F02 TaxID=1698282 RepID=A0A133VJ57_9EURY|nr:N5-carboxyaminoimidazole ribonucleotide mutase [candidate division MSBL1 archaeon SCGC-AAA382F02]
MSGEKIVIIMGSEKDQEFTEPAIQLLEDFDLDYEVRVASAHKTPEELLDILNEYNEEDKVVYFTVAGRSDALSGFVDANTAFPVIACPPYSSKFNGADIFSSLRMPSGVGPLVVLDPENAALAAAKILAIDNPELSEKIDSYKESVKEKVKKSDENV